MGRTKGELKILLIDDADAVRETLELILRHRGYTVASAASGVEAREVIARYTPDILLCDLFLPDGNGVEIALEICQSVEHCRVIFISGNPEAPELLDLASREGLRFEILAKPIFPAELFAVLDAG